MYNPAIQLAWVYKNQGTLALLNGGASVYGFFDNISIDVLSDNGQGIVSVTKKTFRIITSSIYGVIANTSTISFNETTYLIINVNSVGDGLETDLVLQVVS